MVSFGRDWQYDRVESAAWQGITPLPWGWMTTIYEDSPYDSAGWSYNRTRLVWGGISWHGNALLDSGQYPQFYVTANHSPQNHTNSHFRLRDRDAGG